MKSSRDRNSRARVRCTLTSTLPFLSLFLICVLCGCGKSAGPENFTLMTYNLNRNNLDKHSESSRQHESKPAQTYNAAIQVIVNASPDILVIQEIGDPVIFKKFQHALSEHGLDYPYTEYLQCGKSKLNMAVLSYAPFTARRSHQTDTYTIGKTKTPVLRGFIDLNIKINPDYQFRLFTCHLKSKEFHRLGQTDMRRNEARLLGKHIRNALKENPNANILVAGDMNDDYNSATLRELTGEKKEYLSALRPVDQNGNAWTCFDSAFDRYSRTDYILVSRGMQSEVISSNSVVVMNTNTTSASTHRPIFVTFQARDFPH